MHAAVQSGTNVRSQSPKNQPSSSRQTSLVAKNKKSAYGTLHTTEHQIEVNMYQKKPNTKDCELCIGIKKMFIVKRYSII